jgi:hypothetical protein
MYLLSYIEYKLSMIQLVLFVFFYEKICQQDGVCFFIKKVYLFESVIWKISKYSFPLGTEMRLKIPEILGLL